MLIIGIASNVRQWKFEHKLYMHENENSVFQY